MILAGLVDDVVRHRELAVGLTRRELSSPFSGSVFGIAWALLHPLLQMGVYMVVFTYIFQMRFGDGVAGGLDDYQSFILSGMLPWLVWASLLPSACQAITGSAQLVKQADFPASVLPLRTMLTALVPHLVSLAVLMVWVAVRHGTVPWTWALLPAAVLLNAAAMLGACYVLGALCVFLRDIKEVLAVFTTMGIFLTPAFYVPSVKDGLPQVFQWILVINPFSHVVHVYRDCLFWQGIEHPVSWAVVGGLAALLLLGGHRVFERMRIFFGNFL